MKMRLKKINPSFGNAFKKIKIIIPIFINIFSKLNFAQLAANYGKTDLKDSPPFSTLKSTSDYSLPVFS